MTNQSFTVLGIGCTRSSGKDTLAAHLASIDPHCSRYALADRLKDDLRPFIMEHFGFDILACTPEEKEVARPILIAYGCAQRAVNINHWVDLMIADIKMDLGHGNPLNVIPVITDVRFENEVARLKEAFGEGFRFMNLTRIGAPPPTDEEEKHFRQVAQMADRNIVWGKDTEEGQLVVARDVLKWLGMAVDEKASVSND